MKTFTVENMAYTPIPVGHKGESSGNRIVFPIATWMGDIDASTGTFTLVYQRNGDTTPYPVTVTHDQTNVYWAVSSTDLENEGFGQCELTYTLGSTLTKSITFATRTFGSLSGSQDTTTPTPAQSWVDNVIATTGTNASNAAASATAAAASATSAAASANNTVKITSQTFSTQQKQIARENIGANDAANINTGVLPISYGGTGGATAAAARLALSAAQGNSSGNALGVASSDWNYNDLSYANRFNRVSGGYIEIGDFVIVDMVLDAITTVGYNSFIAINGLPKPKKNYVAADFSTVTLTSGYAIATGDAMIDNYNEETASLKINVLLITSSGSEIEYGIKPGMRIAVSAFYIKE